MRRSGFTLGEFAVSLLALSQQLRQTTRARRAMRFVSEFNQRKQWPFEFRSVTKGAYDIFDPNALLTVNILVQRLEEPR